VSVRVGTDLQTRPLLLLNGLGAPLELWEPLRARLAHRTTIAFDAPGCGGSPLPWFPLSIAGLARVAAALLDDLAGELGAEQFDALGYSFGGAIAQELAMFGGTRVGSLVLTATHVGIGSRPGNPVALAALVAPVPVRLLPPGRGSLRALTGDPGTRDDFSRADAAWAARPPNPLGVWWQGLAIASWTSLPWLGRIGAPTLVLTGADDPVVPPANARLLASRIPGAVHRELAGTGHFALIADDPGATTEAIEAFLLDQQGQAQAPAAAAT
jgi:pimeloyl-ACP methyl ester carboxylesterase